MQMKFPASFMKTNKFQIWVVSELYYPEETSTGYFLTKIAEGLTENFPVSALCSQPTYSGRGRRAPVDERFNGVNIHRCWSSVLNKDFFPARIINILTISLSIFISSFRQFKRHDLVFVVTNPPLLPFTVLAASTLRKARCCLIVHDVYPEVLAATKVLKPNSLFIGAIGWLTCQLYQRMAAIVVLGRDMAAVVQKKLNFLGPPVEIIPNWGDGDFVKPRDRNTHPLLEKLGISGKFVVQFSGNIGRTHGIEQILECAEQLRAFPLIHFLFIGFGGKKGWLTQQLSRRSFPNVTLMDYRPRAELPLSLTACDIGIISFVKGMVGVSVPSRMYNVMAAGKPIIAVAEAESELACVVREEGIGWVVPPGDIDALKAAIIEAQRDPVRLDQMGQRARKAAETKYSFERVISAYKELVGRILEKGD